MEDKDLASTNEAETAVFGPLVQDAGCRSLDGSCRANVLVEVNATVRKLAELSSLLDLCCVKALSATRVLCWRMCSSPCIEAILSPRQMPS